MLYRVDQDDGYRHDNVGASFGSGPWIKNRNGGAVDWAECVAERGAVDCGIFGAEFDPECRVNPSVLPSELPSVVPSVVPSIGPSVLPSEAPSTVPSLEPTIVTISD